MRVVFTHAWMQKHPTPTAREGDFHWHPDALPGAIRATLTDLATRERGQRSSLWIIDRRYLAWARTFSAVSPADRRRYTGLVVTVARPEAPAGDDFSRAVPEILARLPLADAAPYAGSDAGSRCELDGLPGADRPLAVDPGSLLGLFEGGDPALTRAICRGGPVTTGDAHDPRLPALVGRLLSWLPPGERSQPRTGVFTARPLSAPRPDGDSGEANFLHYLTGLWFCPAAIRDRAPDYAVACWQLVLDLAASGHARAPDAAPGPADRAGHRPLGELFGDLTRVAQAWDTAANLYRHITADAVLSRPEIAACDRRAPAPLYHDRVADAGRLWNRLLHYWGRGFLSDDALPRLADLLARRVAVDHLFYLDAPDRPALPGRYLRRLRYEALLPARRVADLTREVVRRLPSLSPNPEVSLG